MKNCYEKCPYFCSDSKSKIRCSGLVNRCKSTVLFFETPEGKDEHKDIFCNSYCWQGCPVAQAVSDRDDILREH